MLGKIIKSIIKFLRIISLYFFSYYNRVNAPLEYIFYVTSFSPNVGSVRGGSLVTVLGGGFETTDCSKNEVKFGPKTCEILDGCTSAYVQCKTSDAFIVHEVDNSGSDPCK